MIIELAIILLNEKLSDSPLGLPILNDSKPLQFLNHMFRIDEHTGWRKLTCPFTRVNLCVHIMSIW